MNRTDRLYALVEELRAVAPRPRSARWLAHRFEVSPRTVERDISALQQSGTPIYAEPGRTGGYCLDKARTLPPVNLTPAEAVAMALALRRLEGTPFRDTGGTALRKLIAAMQTDDAAAARDLAGRVHLIDGNLAGPVHRSDCKLAGRVDPSDGNLAGRVHPREGTLAGRVHPSDGTPLGRVHSSNGTPLGRVHSSDGTPTGRVDSSNGTPTGRVHPSYGTPTGRVHSSNGTLAGRVHPSDGHLAGPLIDGSGPPPRVARVVANALSARRVLRIRYADKEGTATTRDIEPLGYVGGREHWYLLAWCRLRDGLRAFRTDRITDVAVTAEVPPERQLAPGDLDIPDHLVSPLTLE